MAREALEAVRLTCDGCGKAVMGSVDEPIDGITVDWTEIDSMGSRGGELWICRPSCLSRAFRSRVPDQEEQSGS